MSVETLAAYHSSNGDSWYLGHDQESGRRFVLHQPNAASGGHSTDYELDVFVSRFGGSIQYRELMRQAKAQVQVPDDA